MEVKARLVLLVGSVYSMTLGSHGGVISNARQAKKEEIHKGRKGEGMEGGKEAERT